MVMSSYIPDSSYFFCANSNQYKANTLYRVYSNLKQGERKKIATAILIGGPRHATLAYGSIIIKAVARYYPSIKHRQREV